jgi:hypothetical protein
MTADPALFNRAFAFDPATPVEVCRAGNHEHHSGKTQVLDDVALDTIVESFREDSRQPNFPGLLVDFEHFSHDSDKSSEAAGWITGLRREGDRLLAEVDWTEAGEAALRSGRYRLLSPVFTNLQELGGNRVRPLRLDGIGLTNQPGIRGLPALANRTAAVSQTSPGPERTPQDRRATYPLPPRVSFQEAVERTKAIRNRGFQDAWNWVSQRLWLLTEHSPHAAPILKNRRAFFGVDQPGDLTAQWSDAYLEAHEREGEFKRYCEPRVSLSQGRRLYAGGITAAVGDVIRLMREWLMKNPGRDFEAAWQWFRESYPVDWACLCLETQFEHCG